MVVAASDGDGEGIFLLIGQAVERLVEDCRARARDQVSAYVEISKENS
jgi:hypothetical protein